MPISNPPTGRVRSLADSEITTLLCDLASPVRLASQSPNGFPLISTLWFIYENGMFWCITQQRTLLRRNLAENPRCAFEIALDSQRFKLLRGQGLATLDLEDGGRVTERMINRYLGDTDQLPPPCVNKFPPNMRLPFSRAGYAGRVRDEGPADF